MMINWTSHLSDPDEKAKFERQILGSKSVLERLAQIMSQDEQELDRSEIDPKVYAQPGWDYKQADTNGYRRCLRNYKQLLNLDPRIIQVKTNDR